MPGYKKEDGYELAGLIWFQGWNNMVGGGNPAYTEQLAHFIRDMRKDLGAPGLPFVIGEMGEDWQAFRELAKANESKPEDDPTRIHPGEFYKINWEQKNRDRLKFQSDRAYHYMGSGLCYYQMGEPMGKAMLGLYQ
ncbi:MAG: sialate O-acetylesterase [Phycisphaeraceae bacterium]|nr:sialate O-acetylesterase [Phycisphaeraceae bacterium]